MKNTLIQSIWKHKQLIIELIKVELLSEFKRSFLGVFWVFFKSLFPLVLWLMLQQAGLFKPGVTQVPYVLYLLTGLSIWNLFHQVYEKSSEALIQYATILKEARFPHEILIYSKALTAILMQGLPSVIAFLLLVFIAKIQIFSVLTGMLFLIPVLFTALSAGIIFSLIRVVLPDIFQITDRLFSLGLYITPIIYTSSIQDGWLKVIIKYNPLTYLIGFPRDIMTGTPINMQSIQIFIVLSAVSILLWFIASIYFRKSEKRFVELLVF